MPLTNIFDPNTAVNTGTDQITIAAHGFLPNQGVLYSNGGGTSIGGLVNNYKYYIIYINSSTVKLANTEDEARDNIAVDLLSIGSGTIHSFTETNIYPNSAAYYDFYRRLRLIGDGLPIDGVTLEADSVRDSLTIIGGNNITFECDSTDIDLDQFTINAPNYNMEFLTGTSRLRLYNDAGLDEQVNFKAGTGMTITHNSLDEIEFTSFGVTESDTLESVTSRGYITNNRLVMNNLTVAEIISTPGVDGVNTVSSTKTGSINVTTAGDGTLDAPLRFSNNVTSSSDSNETVTVYFTVPNAGTLSYVANYISESAILTTGSVTLQRQDPSTLVWTNLNSQSGTLARTGYDITGIYAELYSGPVNYKIIWDWSGNSSFVRISFNVYFEVEPVAGFELIKTDTGIKDIKIGVDDGTTTVRGPATFTGYIDTEGLRIYQNNIVGTNSNDNIIIDLNGTGALELRATTFNTNETTFNLINTTATTVNAFGDATTINIGDNSGTITVRNPTLVGVETTQNVYNTVATTVNAFGAAATLNIGENSGTVTLRNPTLVGTQTTQNVYDTVATTVNAFGAATTIDIGATTGTITINNPTIVGTQTTQNVYDTVATTVNAFRAATTLNIGNFIATGSTIDTADSSGITFVPAVTINSDLSVENNLDVRNQIITDTEIINTKLTLNSQEIALGAGTAVFPQGTWAIAIGSQAARSLQSERAIAIGYGAGRTGQGLGSVAIGSYTGFTSQGSGSVAIGTFAGQVTQGANAVAVGSSAGFSNQGDNAVAIGNSAGQTSQGNSSVAIGITAGYTTQGIASVAIGPFAGYNSQGAGAVAIGNSAGDAVQGQNAIAIGNFAGFLNQHDNSIVLNASGSILNSTGSNRFFVSPIRNVEGNRILFYDSATNEITYGNSNTFTFNGSVIDTTDSSGITFIPLVTFNSDIIVENDLTVNRAMTIGTNLTVTGDLTVNGTTVTLNTTTLDVEDLNITVAKGAATAAAANGAGLTVDGAGATLTYASSDDSWNFNKILKATSLQGTPVGTTTRAAGAFTTLDANGNVTLGDATSDTITISGKFVDGTVLRADTAATNTLALAAYDTDTGPGWTNLITLTSSTTPTLTLTSTGVGTINNMSIGATTASTGRFTTLNVVDTTTTGFNLSLASNSSTALTADRALTFDVVNAARTVKLAGNIDIANNLSTQGAVSFSGAFSFTGTLSNNTSVTFPTTGTLATLAGSESLTNKKLGSLTTNGIVTTSNSDGTLSVTSTTGSGSVVLGTNPTVAGVTYGNTSSTSDADATVDASTTTQYAYVQSASGTTRTISISNLTAGRMVQIYLRNTNAAQKIINIQASTTTSGFAAVNMSKGDAGGTSVTAVTLVASSGTAMVTVFNANGTFAGSIS